MRAYTHRLLTFAIQCAMIVALTFVLSGHSMAQDVPPETPAPTETGTVAPTDAPTEIPTVIPTNVPTEVPTEVVTDVPSEAVTAEPTTVPTDVTTTPDAVTETPLTPAPTDSTTLPPATPVNPDLFVDDFQDAEASGWVLTSGWAVVEDAGNYVLGTTGANETAMLTGMAWPYYTLSFRVLGSVQLSMTAGGSTYQIKVAADGATSLSKDGVLLAEAAGVAVTEGTAEPTPAWHTVNILAPGNLLAVKVDDLTPISAADPALLGMGPLVFSTDAANTAPVALDDINIRRLDAPPPAPTPEPTLAVGTLPPPPELTPEVTVEATVEVTAEATVEATAEVTPEATVEATAEATVEPLGLGDDIRAKLPTALVDALDLYTAGDIEGAQAALADYFIIVDDQQRIQVTIWAVDESAAAAIAGGIPASGGALLEAFSVQLQAFLTLDGLMTFIHSPDVRFIELPPRAVSTSSALRQQMEVQGTGQGTGTEVTEALDTTGAVAWHQANIKGAGVGIAVIDTGFGYNAALPNTTPVGDAGEYACMFNNTINNLSGVSGDTTHGLNMVQVLCDMAPLSNVYMYKATNATNLRAAVLNARTNNAVKVIVIAMDLGASVSPGDGTGGGVEDLLYAELASARAAGKIVIASAGNNQGRYITLNYTSGGVTVPMTVYPGDTIHISWNNWSGSTVNFPSTLSGDFSATINSSRPAAPRNAFPVSTSNCPTGPCSVTLNLSGNAASIVQVQIAGSGVITSSGVNPLSALATAGNIARPADSPNVIAVGAVCNDSSMSLNLESTSAQGPAFAAGGTLNVLGPSFTRSQIKPDLSGPSHVSLFNNPVDSFNCSDPAGFSGTSSAAAHVAGMAALLVSNTNASMSDFDGTTSAAFDAVKDYMQTHTVDNVSVPAFAVGYDTAYGAGLTVLGNPAYDLRNTIVARAAAVDALPATCVSPVYVGLANPGALQDGSITAPYVSMNEAIAKAAANQCVVVLPGEYVAQIYANDSHLTPAVISYESATSFPASVVVGNVTLTGQSNLWSVFQSPIFIDDNDVIVDGFVAQRAGILTDSASGISIRTETPALRIRNSTNTVVQNSTFLLYKSPGTVTDTTGVQIKGSLFSGFIIPTVGSGSFTSPQKNSAILEFTNSTGALVSNNIFQNSTIPSTYDTPNPWQPAIIGVRYSGIRFYNNQFKSNTAATIVGVNQLIGGPGSAKLDDEVQFVSSLFSSNTLNGPLLHLFVLPNLRFVNNTVVSNVMQAESSISQDAFSYDGYFVYGNRNSGFGDLGSREVEIHNNLFYGNSPLLRGLLSDVASGINIGCNAIGAGAPVRNNWFVPFIGANSATNTLPGECVSAGKIVNSIEESINPTTLFFGAAFDAAHPFRVRPTDSSTPTLKGAINTGDDQALIDIFGSDPLTGYQAQMDLRGSMRWNLGVNPNPTYQTTHVDIGAYELGTASAPVPDPITRTVAEDAGTTVSFTLTAVGGYTQTFALSTLPTEYDPNPANGCLGQPARFVAPNTIIYCPPANFHTRYGAGNTDVPVVIGFTVEDKVFKPGELNSSTISLTITPQEDGTPTATDFNSLSDYFTPITQQLSPIVQFGNFALSGTGGSVDFPYTFAFGAKIPTLGEEDDLLKNGPSGDSTVQVLTDAFAAANTNGGKLILNPVAGRQGFYKFTYTVTDQDGDVGTGNGTIVILPTLAQEGVYDDASFNFVYTGSGWNPSFVAGAYNNTLHATSAAGNTLEIPFSGSVIRFYLRGSTSASSTLKTAFQIDIGSGSSPYESYNNTKTALGAGFTCVNSLNSLAPDANSDVVNFSATGAAYTITCSGFPTGQVHSVRLTTNNATALTVDRAEISAGVMTAGKVYQENSPNITYTGTWLQGPNASMLGGAWAYTNQNGATFSFKIDSSVGRVVFYRTVYNARYGTSNIYLDGNLVTPIATMVNNNSTTLKFGQPFILTIANPGNHTITVRNMSATYGSIDQITTLPIAQAMGVGTYQENYPDLTYSGTWVQGANGSMLGGAWAYTNENNASVTFKIDSSVSRIELYRVIYAAGVYGTMSVYLDGSPIPLTTIPNNTSATLLFGQPIVINIPTPGAHTVRLQNIGATYGSIDQIKLLGAVQPLTTTPGVYQENDLNLIYTGKWTQAAHASAISGRWAYTNESGASVSFKIDSSVSRVVIYRTTYLTGSYGTMNVYVDDDPTPIAMVNTSASLQFGQTFVLDVTPGNHTIKIQNVGTTYGSIDQIRLLGSLADLGPGTYQDNDLNLTYTGNWTADVNASMLGGTRRYTNQPTASFKFTVNNSVERIVFYRTTAVGWGSMQIEVNGVAVLPNMINVGTATSFGQPFMVTIPLPANGVEIEVTNLEAKFSDIDQIVLLGAPERLSSSSGVIQDTSTAFTYTGNWISQANTLALGGTRRYTSENNAEVSFLINNTVSRIVIYRTVFQAPSFGTMQVYIDGSLHPDINQRTIPNTGSSSVAYGRPFEITIPSTGNHKISIRNVGTTFGDIDQILLLPAATRLTAGANGTSYQDNHEDITYTGTWVYGTHASMSGNSWHYTTQNGAEFSFDIDSSVGRIVFYRPLYLAGVYGTMQVFVDGVLSTTIANNTSTTLLFKQPFVMLIGTPGDHTITVRNIGTTYGVIDQIDLLPPTTTMTDSPGVYQEDNVNLTYRGVWTQFASAQMLSGAWRFTSDPNGSVTFDIDSSVSRIVVYRATAPTYGSMQVFLDNSATALVTIPNNTSTALMVGQPFEFNIPTPGAHTVTIKNVGATISGIDQISLLGAPERLGLDDYQEDDPALVYSNNWVQAANASAFGGSWRYTNVANATVKFDIDATVGRVVVYRSTNVAPTYGSMQVFLDGNLTTPIATISSVSATALHKQPYVVTIANPGNHTITIRNVAATYSGIDQITLLEPAAELVVGDYQESSLDLAYNGTWTQGANANMLGSAWAYTNTAGSSVSFKVDDSVVKRMIVYRTTSTTGVYGTMQVLLNGVVAVTMNNATPSLMYRQPFFVNIPTGTTTVELRNVGALYGSLDQITLLGDPDPNGVNGVGFYEENNPLFTYTGAWSAVTGTEPSGNGAYYTYAPNATVTFKVTGTSFSIYRVLTAGAGTFTVTIDGAPAGTYANTATGGVFWQQPIEFGGLTNTTHTVVITKTSPATDFIYFDAVRVVNPAAALTVGQYQENYPGLTYTGAWTQNATNKSSTTAGNTMTFSFTGTGFGIITATPLNGAEVDICYTLQGGSAVCANNLPATQANVGYSFYNLKQGTYNVTVTHSGAGTGSALLAIDRVFVMNTPAATLQPGTYEENAAGIVYSPRDLWISATSPSYSGGTVRVTSQKGAVVQIRFNGNSLFLYQLAWAGAASNLQLCVLLTDAAGNPTSLCSTYSQNTPPTTFVAPVAFYGFGSGVHEVVIENRSQQPFNIDRILVN
ncbi:MAG: hypothetical protein IT321_24010 [Anaerolineae bacterium]|nr:hypothetical protein [Anaerolineae bacterium]